tara:strand:- start:5637 stop:5828 length:192 start_codon:yes stop_codon:yes gene_type:complete
MKNKNTWDALSPNFAEKSDWSEAVRLVGQAVDIARQKLYQDRSQGAMETAERLETAWKLLQQR